MAWGAGASVEAGKTSASSILFACNGAATVRQVEVCESVEVRGMDVTHGKAKVPDEPSEIVDNTVQTLYWASIGGVTYAINAVTGTKEEWSAARRDESGQWVATKTTHTYFVTGLDTNVWGTTELDADGASITLSNGGKAVTVSRDKTSSLAFRYGSMPLITTVETVNVEYRYVADEAAASAIVSANSTIAGYETVSTYVAPPDGVLPGPYAFFTIPYGTEKFASARYVSPKHGWSVSVTTKTYGFVQGNGWHL